MCWFLFSQPCIPLWQVREGSVRRPPPVEGGAVRTDPSPVRERIAGGGEDGVQEIPQGHR